MAGPLLKKDNAGENLPNSKITVIHRAEGSGTTAAFTTYLTAVSPEWAQQVSKGTSVKWPTGLGAKGSEGVTGQVKQMPGTISYVELTYATQNKLPVAAIKNQAEITYTQHYGDDSSHRCVQGSTGEGPSDVDRQPTSIRAGCISYFHTDLPDHPERRERCTEAGGAEAIPRVCGDGWATSHSSLNYAPLPDGVKQQDVQALNQLTVNGSPIH